MKTWLHATLSLFICLTLLNVTVIPALAASNASGPADQPTDSLAEFTLTDLGKDDLVARQVFKQFELEFPLAEGWQVSEAVLNLHLSHGKKLLPELSDLTIALNDEPLTSLILSEENAEAGFLPIDIPGTAFLPGRNVLVFRFNLRLNADGCSDQGSSSLWARVLADSNLRIRGRMLPIVVDLSRFPAPFNTLSTLPGSPSLTFVLPDDPLPGELTAAARLAAILGQDAGWDSPPLRAITTSEIDSQAISNDHLIVISQGERNPLSAGTEFGLTGQASPFNPTRLMLVVVGKDEPELLRAADSLATRSARLNLRGTHYVPPELVPALPLVEQPDRQAFDNLGFVDRRVRGIGMHDLYYAIDVPYDWKVTSDASIDLRFTHARNLNSPDSAMNIFINGKPAQDVALNNRNAQDGRVVIQLSPRQLHPGRNWLHLNIDLHLNHESCSYRYLEEAWLEVSAANSVLYLAHVISEPPLELRYLPSPLVTPLDLSADLFVLPEEPGAADLTGMVKLAAKLGTYTQADSLRPSATTANNFDPAASRKSKEHLQVIAIGTPSSNALLASFDEKLPQPLRLEAGAVVPVDGRQLLPEEAASDLVVPEVGYLELLLAPWSHLSRLVVVAAYEPDSMQRVVEIIPASGARLHSRGNVAVVTSTKVKGLALDSLSGASLAGSERIMLALVLIGIFAITGLIAWLMNLRQKKNLAEMDSSDDIE